MKKILIQTCLILLASGCNANSTDINSQKVPEPTNSASNNNSQPSNNQIAPSSANPVVDIALQKDCASQAQIVFNKRIQEFNGYGTGIAQSPDFQAHYNSTQHRCYIDITYITYNNTKYLPDTYAHLEDLMDVIEYRYIGGCLSYSSPSTSEDKLPKDSCTIGKNGTTWDDFHKQVDNNLAN